MVDYSEILDEEQRNFYAAEEIQGKDYTECFSDEDTENRWELIYKGDGLEQDAPLPDLNLVVGVGKVVLPGGTVQGQGQGPPVGDPKGVGVGEKAVGDELKLGPVPGQGVPDRGVPLVVQGRDAQLLQAVRSVLEAGVP